MKGKHAQKNFGAVGTMAPTPLSLEIPGGGGGGAGGCRIQGPDPAAPQCLLRSAPFSASAVCPTLLPFLVFPSPPTQFPLGFPLGMFALSWEVEGGWGMCCNGEGVGEGEGEGGAGGGWRTLSPSSP